MVKKAGQTTLKRAARFQGVGLHTGAPCEVVVHPADPDTGFLLHPSGNGARPVLLSPDAVTATRYRTEIAGVSSMEHLLSALAGLGIDNARLEVTGPELPALDGSALPFVQGLRGAGLVTQPGEARCVRLKAPVRIRDQGAFIEAIPDASFGVSYTIDYGHPWVGRQSRALVATPESFQREIAPARTFGFLEHVPYLRESGFALGGSLDNALVLDGHGPLNPEGARFADECVRHKILDLLGDLSLLPGRPVFRVVAHRAGHRLHHRLVKTIVDNGVGK